eukprot:3941813-Rhodomonas_salina.1
MHSSMVQHAICQYRTSHSSMKCALSAFNPAPYCGPTPVPHATLQHNVQNQTQSPCNFLHALPADFKSPRGFQLLRSAASIPSQNPLPPRRLARVGPGLEARSGYIGRIGAR